MITGVATTTIAMALIDVAATATIVEEQVREVIRSLDVATDNRNRFHETIYRKPASLMDAGFRYTTRRAIVLLPLSASGEGN